MRPLDETDLQQVSGGLHWPYPMPGPQIIVPPGAPVHKPSGPPVPLPYPWFPPMPLGI